MGSTTQNRKANGGKKGQKTVQVMRKSELERLGSQSYFFKCRGLTATLDDQSRHIVLLGQFANEHSHCLLHCVEDVPPRSDTENALVRADQVFLVTELVLIGLFLVGLMSGSASQIAAVDILMSGNYAVLFWGGVITVGIVTPLVLQALQLAHRIPHTIIPAILVLAGGLALRWVMVGAGQASQMVASGGM